MISEIVDKLIYQCTLCDTTFTRAENFKKHFKKVHFLEISVCRKCSFFTNKLSDLFLHARELHNERSTIGKLKCQLCSYSTDNGGLMKHHYRSHMNYQPYKCEICNKRFTQKSNMKTHFNRHKRNQFDFSCQSCNKQFNSHDIYLSHLETREHFLGQYIKQLEVKFNCLLCKVVFDSPNDAFNHQNQCKYQKINQIVCGECYKSFPYELDEIEEHHKMHKKIICDLCEPPSYLDDIPSFNSHLTIVHRNRVERRKVCRYCEMVFDNEEIRNNHIEIEHPNFKNTHRNAETNGRIICSFENCDFKTNSEILLQKHFQVAHCKDLDLDIFYKNNIKPEPNNVVPETSRKRGRPRICDNMIPEDLNNQILSPEPKKQRGRPKKSTTSKEESFTEPKKRGRPKKIKLDPSVHNTDCAECQNSIKQEACESKIEHVDAAYLEHIIPCDVGAPDLKSTPLSIADIKQEAIDTYYA